jgi:predicted transcriptional regulator of viral defense system
MQQPMKFLSNWLEKNSNNEHYLFSTRDLRQLFLGMSNSAFKTLLSRAARIGHLVRVCRGLYAYQKAIPLDGHFLFHVAAYLRAHEFNYISHETVLSDLGIISQIPISTITIMSSGRSNRISCGRFGRIEFVHTSKKPTDIMEHLFYDARCGLWRADAYLALRDMKAAHRNCDLIDWEVAHEFV